MFKLCRCVYLIIFLLLPLTAGAIEAGDPDSDSAPMVLEPEAVTPPNVPQPNAQTHDDVDDVKAEPLPGEHLVPEATPPSEEDKWHDMKFARLQGLNKVTARTSEIKADVGANTKFGNLEFVVEKCLRGPENEKVENTVLLKVWDEIPGQDKKEIFHGWMFSSSPAISALEHPIYDIILLGCGEAPKPVAIPAAAADGKKPAEKKDKKPKANISVQ